MTCDLCPRPADWLWNPGIADPFYLCDSHAASKDLSDLSNLRDARES